jgi:hypothetical protein
MAVAPQDELEQEVVWADTCPWCQSQSGALAGTLDSANRESMEEKGLQEALVGWQATQRYQAVQVEASLHICLHHQSQHHQNAPSLKAHQIPER